MSKRGKSDENPVPFIVGVGASAGGLNVLKEFVRTISEDTNMAFIIVQHLDPNHKSLLSDILSRESAIPVKVPEEKEVIRPAHVYVIPPHFFLEVENGKIRLVEQKLVRGMRQGIDHLFGSIAKDCGHRCAGIVMTGSGNDGTSGLRKIRAAGGLSMAQSPEQAEHPSMPESAVTSGVVDKVMDVRHLMQELKRFEKHQPWRQEEVDHMPDSIDVDGLQDLAVVLELHEGFDIRQYKENTVVRRLVRRMGLVGEKEYGAYLERVRKDGKERKQLVQDLLINVTDFFRDGKAFSTLKKKAVKPLVDNLEDDEVIRIWIPGCATGEEAYTIAMIFLEVMEDQSREVRIFATDVDQQAIETARKGIYPESITSEVPEDLLKKYFVQLDNGYYKVKSSIRDLISFAIHNVITDPPFSNMHLISCRNLLIYLQKDIQEQILSAMEFATRAGGYLFLGTAETLGKNYEGWDTVSSKWRIYKRDENARAQAVLQRRKRRSYSPVSFASHKRTSSSQDQIRDALLKDLLSPTIVVNMSERIIYNHGNVANFLRIPEGEPNYQLFQVVHTEIRSKIRSALFKVKKDGGPVTFHHSFKDSPSRVYQIDVHKLIGIENTMISITFIEDKNTRPSRDISVQDENKTIENLELTLAETKQELHNTIEELESNSEELKAAHEEAISTNEELQSANEELEASSEELRSLNEEMRTVNEQLKEKINELQKSNNDIQNFFTSTNIPTIFLDPDFKIKRYTPAAEHLLNISRSDMNRPVYALGSELVDGKLIDDAKEVLFDLKTVSSEKRTADGRYFMRSVTPYQTEDRQINGVVVSFHDITESKLLSRRAESREKQQAVIAKLGMLALGGMDLQELFDQLVVEIARTLEAEYCKILKYQPEEDNFLLISGTGWDDGLVGSAVVPGNKDSQAGYTYLSQDAVLVEDLSEEDRFTGPEILIRHKVVSGMSCVINHSDPAYGVLGVHSRRKRVFTRDDANFIVSAANLLSVAIREHEIHGQMLNNEAKFRTLANTIPQLAWMTDKTGYITWFNDRWFEFTGANMTEMEGWGWQRVQHPDHVERVMKKFKDHIAIGEEWEDTFPLRGKNGKYRWFLSRACPVRNEGGKIINWFGTNTDITAQLEIEQALGESEEKLRIAKDSGRLGAFEYYFQEDLVILDSFLSNLWGYSEKGRLSHSEFWGHLTDKDRASMKRLFNDVSVLEHGGHMETEFRLIPEDSEEVRFVESSGQVLFEKDIPVKMIGMIIDITERKLLENQLNDAINELQVSNQKKNQFLATLGHELRNPLASISGGLELLLLEQPDTEQLRIIGNGVEQMSSLLDDLLDLTRIERGKIRLDKKVLNLTRQIRQITKSFSRMMEDHGILYEVHIPEEPAYILADNTRIEQIFNNLLTNACKFTPRNGSVTVEMTTTDEKAIISIKDSGVGIRKGLEEKIFQPFEQIDPDATNPGLGIGLSLVRQFVELHEGSIEVQSSGKKMGSTFIIELPLTSSREEEKITEVEEDFTMNESLTIMIVDDNLDTAHLLSMILRQKNFQTISANTGREALEKIRDAEPDVFILDIGLPDMNGYELLGEVKKQYKKEAIFIAHTGYGHDQARKESAASGFDYHLNKPLKIKDLLRILKGNEPNR